MADTETPSDPLCDREGCDHLAAWDMAAIVFDEDVWLCSPDCARAYLETLETAPSGVFLHDPQFAVDRSEFSDAVTEDHVNIRWPVTGLEEANAAVARIESLYPTSFRPKETEA